MPHVFHPGDAPNGHRCSLRTDHTAYGRAVDECTQDVNGRLWANNDEYCSMVHFCPVCGTKAPTPPTNTPPGEKK